MASQSVSRDERDLIDVLQSVARHLVGITASAWAVSKGPRRTTLPGYRLLVVLATVGPHHPGQLAQELNVTPAAVTQMLATLSRSRLVAVHRDASDRRLRTVDLTALGRRAVDAVSRERARRLSAALGALSTTDRREARRILRKLDSALGGVRATPM